MYFRCRCADLQSLGSVDGPQWPEHSQNSQDLHHINCTGPENTQWIRPVNLIKAHLEHSVGYFQQYLYLRQYKL